MGEQRRAGIINILISIVSILLVFVFLYQYAGFIFLTNDDLTLKAIVSGELTGTPEAHMIYSHYLLGLCLSGLYSITDAVPWYGIYLTASFAISLILILYRLLCGCKRGITKVAVTLSFVLLTVMLLSRNIAMLQYTVVAGVVGSTAIFWTLTMNMNGERKYFQRDMLVSLLLVGLCFLIRGKVFYMLLPFAGCMWLAKWILEKEKKKLITRYSLFVGSTVVLIALLSLVDEWAYRDAEWSEYRAFNESRETIYDYYGFPDYKENQTLYEELGISEASYLAASENYMLLIDDHFNAEAMEALADRAKELTEKESVFPKKLKEVVDLFIERNLEYTDRPINIVIYLIYILFILYILATGQYAVFLSVGALFFSRMATWFYLIWQGRLPDRITQSLYIVELVILLAIFIEQDWKEKISKRYLAFGMALVLCLSMYLGIPKLQAVKGENAGKAYFGVAYEQVKEYAAAHPENFYLLDMNSFSSFTRDVFKTKNFRGLNALVMGSWLPNSPHIQKRLELAGIENLKDAVIHSDNVYVIFGDDENIPTDYLTEYYEEEYPNAQFVIIDNIKTDVGFSFIVGKEK